MKRLFLTLAVLPVLALAQANPSGIFLDVLGHPHEAYVDLLRSRGIVQGYGYGIFRPDILINRAEFLKILMLAVHGGEVYAIKDRNCFRDFTGPEQWFWSHVCTAKSRGIVEGYPDGAFRGEQPVILAEALKMTAETYGVPFPQYVQAPPNWYDPSMDLAATRGLFDYFPFNPGHLLTRSEMAYLIVRFGEPIAYLQGVQGPSSSSRRSSPSTVSSKPPSQPPSSSCGNGFLDPGEQCDDGNRRDGDGCSSICILVKEPIRHAAMRIEQRELLSTGYASGVQDVTLLAFDAIAGRQDAWLTGVILVRGSGSFTAATNFRLFADLDGNGTAERAVATASPQGARLAFHNFQVRTPQSIAVRFEVRADLSTTSGSDRLGIAFATDDAGFISAAGEDDGQDLTGIVLNDEDCGASLCWIRVLTAPLSVISVHTVGSLYVTRDSVPVSSRQLLAGGTTDVLLRLTLRAVKEDIELKRIAIQGASSNADRLEILEAGGSSPFAIARSAQCPVLIAGQYCASSSFAIPEGKEKRIVVRAVVKADTAGVDTSQTVALSLTATTGMQHAIEARGKFSGVDLQQNDGDGSEEGEMYVGTASPAANVAITHE
jgi:cysteine-rich repeat protein